ncbi:hypothetical protein ACP70R_005627 [Stipagrostis hirtigluma subsp. patula]
MSRDRANWDERTTSLFLELVVKQKELCHWSDKYPTSIGWTNIHRSFNDATKLGYTKKQLQNKYGDLKRAYFNWRDGLNHTGLGRDPVTGEVEVDPVWYAATQGDSSQQAGEKYKRPPCCDQLFAIFGHTPRDRGELVSAGGHGTEPQSPQGPQSPQTPQHTPQHMADEDERPRTLGQSSKRSSREQSVCSPLKKKTTASVSLDDCLEDISDIIKGSRERKTRRATEAEEIAKVKQILKEDGYSESDELYVEALTVCTDRLHRAIFLDFESKDGRMKYVKAAWKVMTAKAP